MSMRSSVAALRKVSRSLLVAYTALTAEAADLCAQRIQWGGMAIDVPPPAGFVILEPSMKSIHENLPPTPPGRMLLLARYVLEAEGTASRNGEDIAPTRLCVVGGDPDFQKTDVGQWFFQDAKSKTIAMSANADGMRIVNDRLQKWTASQEAEVGKASPNEANSPQNSPPEMEVQPFSNEPRSLCFTRVVRCSVPDDLGVPVLTRLHSAGGLVHVNARMLALGVEGAPDDPEWSKECISAWVKDIIAANPPTEITLAAEQRGEQEHNLRSSELWANFILSILAMVGCAFALRKIMKKKSVQES